MLGYPVPMDERACIWLFVPPMVLLYLWVLVLIARLSTVTADGKTLLAFFAAVVMGLGAWWYFEIVQSRLAPAS